MKLFVAAGALGSEVGVFQAMESLSSCLEPSFPPSQCIIATGGRRGLVRFHAGHLPPEFRTFSFLSPACSGTQGGDLSVIYNEPCCTVASHSTPSMGCTSRRLKYTWGTNPALGFSGIMVTWLHPSSKDHGGMGVIGVMGGLEGILEADIPPLLLLSTSSFPPLPPNLPPHLSFLLFLSSFSLLLQFLPLPFLSLPPPSRSSQPCLVHDLLKPRFCGASPLLLNSRVFRVHYHVTPSKPKQ